MTNGQSENPPGVRRVLVPSRNGWKMVNVAEEQENYIVVVDGKGRVFVFLKTDIKEVDDFNNIGGKQLSLWGDND